MAAIRLTATDLRSALDARSPKAVDGATAAVAVVFRSGVQGTELLFIQRATKDTDPWSGHMAFPGGRTDPGDRNAHHTAERETLEEVDLDLNAATRLGSLSDLRPGRHLQAVHAVAYWIDGTAPTLTANYEVADIVWVPLWLLADPNRYIDVFYRPQDHDPQEGRRTATGSGNGPEPKGQVASTPFVAPTRGSNLARDGASKPTNDDHRWPGIQLDEPTQVVWGLTLRFLADLFDRLDTPFIELAPWPSTDED